MNIYAQFADVTGVLFLDLGKYDIALLRCFYQNLIEEAKDETDVGFFKQINPIESHFVEGSVLDNNKCDSSKDCFAYVGTISESKAKILELLAPILKVSMKTKPYHQLADELFQEIYFYFNDEKLFASFPYMIERVKNYQPLVTAFKSNPEYFSNLSHSMANKYKTEIIDTIHTYNYINFSTCVYDDLLFNPTTVTSFTTKNFLITPFFNKTNPWAETGSFSFKPQTSFNCQDTSSYTKENFADYIGGKWQYDVLNQFSISLTNKTKDLYAMLVSNTESMLSLSWQVCKILKRLGKIYSDAYTGDTERNETETKISLDMNISSCFVYDKARKIIEREFSPNATQYTVKRLQLPFAAYSSSRDINSELQVKVFQYFTPSNYIRSLINSPFYTTYTFYYFIVKIQNSFHINQRQIYNLFFNLIFFILLISLIVWVIIFLLLWTRVCVVASSISSPINKLIANISNSQDITNMDESSEANALVVQNDIDNISYKDDKDIDDLFKICQVLIVGGFKQKEFYKRNNAMNVYNNVAVVKTNNLMINEYEIESKKDEDYHEIFKDEEVRANKNLFEKEVYKKFETEKLKNAMKEFYCRKFEKLEQKAKNEFTKKEKNDDCKFLRMVNKDIEEYLPINNLYKLYTEEMLKKDKAKSGNKKEKKK